MYKRKDGYLRLVTLLVFRLVERIEKYAAGAEHLNRPLCVRMTYISNVLVQLLLHTVFKITKNVSFEVPVPFYKDEHLKENVSDETILTCFYWNIFENFQILWTDVILYSEHLGKSAFSISSAPLLGIQDSTRWVLVILVCIHQVFVIYKPQTWKTLARPAGRSYLKQTHDYWLKLFYFDVHSTSKLYFIEFFDSHDQDF